MNVNNFYWLGNYEQDHIVFLLDQKNTSFFSKIYRLQLFYCNNDELNIVEINNYFYKNKFFWYIQHVLVRY